MQQRYMYVKYARLSILWHKYQIYTSTSQQRKAVMIFQCLIIKSDDLNTIKLIFDFINVYMSLLESGWIPKARVQHNSTRKRDSAITPL